MSAICIIPARGGSRRIPRKNLRMFHGKPMMAWAIEAAKDAGVFDKIVVSTEDQVIAGVAHDLGAHAWWRPPELAHDDVGTQDVIAYHLVNAGIENTYACCLYATACMVDPQYLKLAIATLQEDPDAAYVVPVARWLADPGMFYMGLADRFVHRHPLIHGATRLLQVDPRRAIDINTEEDWTRAAEMFKVLHEGA